MNAIVINDTIPIIEVIADDCPVIEVIYGKQGDSAYQIWLEQGNIGSETDFLNSLIGTSGESAWQAAKDGGYPSGNTEAQFNSDLATVSTKQNALGFTPENVANKATDLSTNDNIHYPTTEAVANSNATTLAAAKSYTDSTVVGLWNDRGSYDASSNTYPSTGGIGVSGAIEKGDIWTISVSGTLGGTAVSPGMTVRALANTPGQTSTNWAIGGNNIGYVPENIANKDQSGGYVGLTLLKINFKNALNTITSFFTNNNSASRTYTFPDKDGTVAMTSDISSVGTLDTTQVSSQSTNLSESFSGNIKLHKISKTGNYTDLNGLPSIPTTTDGLAEGSTNLYFTTARVLATLLSGFSALSGTITTSDTILTAFNKIVGNIATLVPQARNLTINGTQYDLSSDRSWTIVPGGAGSDTTAIHTNVANEISTITENTSLADNDLLLEEDSANSGVKKKFKLSTLATYIQTKLSSIFESEWTYTTLNLPVANWSSNAQTISGITGLTSSSYVRVSPPIDRTSSLNYGNAQISATALGTGTITFTNTTNPTVDINNVQIAWRN